VKFLGFDVVERILLGLTGPLLGLTGPLLGLTDQSHIVNISNITILQYYISFFLFNIYIYHKINDNVCKK